MNCMTKRILHIVSADSGLFGGIESYLCNYYECMDQSKIVFDFSFWGLNSLIMKMKEPIFDHSVFTEYKALLLHTNNAHKHGKWLWLFRSVRKHVRSTPFDIVEVHNGSVFGQAICGAALLGTGVPMKILHTHSVHVAPTSWKKRIPWFVCSRFIRRVFDYYFSCSLLAASLFGDRIINSKRFRLIHNAIPLQKFRYNSTMRDQVRAQLNIRQDDVVIGHVARLSKDKNQLFLLDIFELFCKTVPNASLWIVGEGECRRELEQRIKELALDDRVKLWHERNDVPDLLQAMDAFVITSPLEGLCISTIESQAAGLPTLASTGVPKECEITPLLNRIDLSEGAAVWAKKLEEMLMGFERKDIYELIKDSVFNIVPQANKLQRFYCGSDTENDACGDTA